MERIIVVVKDSHISQINEVSKQAENLGMKVSAIYPMTGILVGFATKEVVGWIKDMDSITGVELDSLVMATRG